ncbi:MAG TPA: hypothetical protein VFL36_14240 [Myxococcales bacterium]|nr:hypothetical protein [Myxococcales bacterium]
MADALTGSDLAEMLEQLPHETENAQDIARRVRFDTSQGRTVFAFARAGGGPLSFTGLEFHPGMTGEEDWDYFVLGAEKAGDPLQVINRKGLLGVVTAAELESRGK